MNRRGEWITPFYNGHPWFEKPILLYWLAKPFMFSFGDVVGPRIPSVLASIGTYLLIAWFARRRWDDHIARWCVLVTASSLLVVALGRMMMTDAVLALCLAGAFIFFWESLAGDRRWRLLSAFFLGLSVLAKGPVGLLLFVPVVAWTFWREKDLRPAFKGWWLVGIVVLAATVATWYLPAYLVNRDEFVQKFLIEQNLNRFTGGDAAHTPPFLTGLPMYAIVLLVGMLPWSLYVWKAWPRNSDPLGRYLAVWAVVPFVFFTISKAKLPHYILPCCVPLALIVGTYLARRNPEGSSTRQLRYPATVAVVVAVVANLGFLYYYNLFHTDVHQLARYVEENAGPRDDISAYQLSRQNGKPNTTGLRINETSHPSLVMYLDRPVLDTSDFAEILADPNAQWIITRAGRVGPAEESLAAKEMRDLREVDTPIRKDFYRLYRLGPVPAERIKR